MGEQHEYEHKLDGNTRMLDILSVQQKIPLGVKFGPIFLVAPCEIFVLESEIQCFSNNAFLHVSY